MGRIHLQCRGLGFTPWVRKMPWRGHGNPLQYSCLQNSMGREAGWATVHKDAKSWTTTEQLTLSLFICIHIHFSSVTQSCPTLCDSIDCSTPGRPVHHQLPEFTRTHVHRVGDAIQPSHPLSSPSPAPNPSQHHGLFQ